MSMVQQIIQAVTASERQIEEQIRKLTAYNDAAGSISAERQYAVL